MKAPVIRPFRPEDLPPMQAVREAAFAPIFRSFRNIVGARVAALALAEAESEQRQLLNILWAAESKHHVFVVMIDEAIIGFCAHTFDAAVAVSVQGALKKQGRPCH